jgi:predicted nicotinamide N-methyase
VPDVEQYIKVCAATELTAVPLVPEIALYSAENAYEVWEITSRPTGEAPVPYWSFPWPGGQALARHLLDHRELVAGRVVLDLAAGSGLVAIAAAMAGASRAIANDVDELAGAAQELNARANGVRIEPLIADLLDGDPPAGVDVVVAGDVCYERDLAARLIGFLERAADTGALVILADPGRTYLPNHGLDPIASYDVPTSLAIEGDEVRHTTLWRPRAERSD